MLGRRVVAGERRLPPSLFELHLAEEIHLGGVGFGEGFPGLWGAFFLLGGF